MGRRVGRTDWSGRVLDLRLDSDIGLSLASHRQGYRTLAKESSATAAPVRPAQPWCNASHVAAWAVWLACFAVWAAVGRGEARGHRGDTSFIVWAAVGRGEARGTPRRHKLRGVSPPFLTRSRSVSLHAQYILQARYPSIDGSSLSAESTITESSILLQLPSLMRHRQTLRYYSGNIQTNTNFWGSGMGPPPNIPPNIKPNIKPTPTHKPTNRSKRH